MIVKSEYCDKCLYILKRCRCKKIKLGFLTRGAYFLHDGIEYRIERLTPIKNGYVACFDIVNREVKRFHINTEVEIIK